MLLQLRVNSASWVPVAFKIPVKKAFYLPLKLHTQAAWAALQSAVPLRLVS